MLRKVLRVNKNFFATSSVLRLQKIPSTESGHKQAIGLPQVKANDSADTDYTAFYEELFQYGSFKTTQQKPSIGRLPEAESSGYIDTDYDLFISLTQFPPEQDSSLKMSDAKQDKDKVNQPGGTQKHREPVGFNQADTTESVNRNAVRSASRHDHKPNEDEEKERIIHELEDQLKTQPAI